MQHTALNDCAALPYFLENLVKFSKFDPSKNFRALMGVGSGVIGYIPKGYILPPGKNFSGQPLRFAAYLKIMQKLTRNSGHNCGHIHPHP